MASYESLFAPTREAEEDVNDNFEDTEGPSPKRMKSSYTLIVGPKVSSSREAFFNE